MDRAIHLTAEALVRHAINDSLIEIFDAVEHSTYTFMSVINWFAKWNFTCKPIKGNWTWPIKSYQCDAIITNLCFQYFAARNYFL